MQERMDQTEDMDRRQLKGWHVLFCLFVFFGVMGLVNSIFVYHAVTSFPGEHVRKSYRQGLTYNQTLARRAAQQDLGWTAEAGLKADHLVFRLFDQQGRHMQTHDVAATIQHRATDRADHVLKLFPDDQGGYVASVQGLGSGQWRIRFDVFEPGQDSAVFQAEKTVRRP